MPVASHLASDEDYVSFGQGVDSSVVRGHDKRKVYGVGDRNPTAIIPLGYKGTLTVNMNMTNGYWLLGLLGANADGGSGPYIHTYTETDILPTFTVVRESAFGTTTGHETFFGCVVNTMTLTAAVNEPVRITLECPYRFDTLTESANSGVTDQFQNFTFAGGIINIDGQVVAAIQNLELTIMNTVELVYGTGSRFAQGVVAKQREYNFRLTTAIKDYFLLKRFYNGSTGLTPDETSSGEMTSMVLTFTNPDGDTIAFNFANVHFNENTLPQSPTEVVKEDIAGFTRTLTNVIYTNSVEIAPAQASNITP